MEKNSRFRYGLILIGVGIIIGLLVSAGMDVTRHSDANSLPLPQGEAQASEQVNPIEGIAVLEQLSAAYSNVAERVNPSVVTIFTETVVKNNMMANHPFQEFFGEEFFKRYFGNPNQEYRQSGLGSGVIISSDGIIITNNHVVDKADDIKVRLMDGEEYVAEVKGRDERTDLAVLKIDVKNLPALPFGDSDKTRVGALVLAIGSPLSPELAHTVTSGIISAKSRSGVGPGNGYQDYIQTDAAINRGNSGGALVNLRGELIGINSAIVSSSGGFIGIGLAIPSNLVNKVKTDILERGRVVRGWLGVYIQNLNANIAKGLGMEKPEGVLISGIQENSPAEKAGIQVEDVILEVDGRKVKNTIELSTRVQAAGPDNIIKIKLLRDGKEKAFSVKLEEYPEEETTLAVETKKSVRIGIELANVNANLVREYNLKIKKDAVVITAVERSSVAAQTGMQPGDLILKVNRKSVANVGDYDRIMSGVKPGDTVLFYVQRGEGKSFVAFSVPEN